jgi:hypothetical protein
MWVKVEIGIIYLDFCFRSLKDIYGLEDLKIPIEIGTLTIRHQSKGNRYQ